MSMREFCKWFADNYEKLVREMKENAERQYAVQVEELFPCLKSKMERDWEKTKDHREKMESMKYE